MALSDNKKTIYYTDSSMQLREIRHFRAKVVGVVGISTIVGIILLFAINHFVFDFMGMASGKIEMLARENAMLEDQLARVSVQVNSLESALNRLDAEGDKFRLLVDLPTMDQETKSGGMGGALPVSPAISMNEGVSAALNSTSALLQKLSGEMRVQEQSYAQILKKYDYNKGYFAALPALKPMDGYYSTSGFGLRMHPVLGIFKTHSGLDIVADVGTPVVAAGDGVIEMAGQSGGGYGTLVAINHGFGYQTLYAHLSSVFVREGQRVKRGDVIAKSGRTGLVSGPHLHYEVRYKGACQNPVNFFFDDIRAEEYRKQVASR